MKTDRLISDYEKLCEKYKEYRENPLCGTDLNRPLKTIIEEVRQNLVDVRDKLYDIEHGFITGKEMVDHVSGLLTCGLIALYMSKELIVEPSDKDEK